MKRKPPPPPAASGLVAPPSATRLPNLDDFETEATRTRQTETSHRAPASARKRARPTLTVLTGVDAGRVISLDAKTTIGRASECQLALSDPGVSRRHAMITARGGALTIVDLDSKNGTYVEGERVVAAQLLEPNQVIQIGPNVRVRFATMSDAEEKLARDLYDSSMRDPLTRAYNRCYFSNRLKAEMTFAARHKTVLSVLVFDLDHFKKLNDTFGHGAGDAVLKRVVSAVTATLRTEDVLARVGGEEFAVLLRGIGHASAVACAERVRLAVQSSPASEEGETIHATISLGLADSVECGTAQSGKLLELADKRLYKAKAAGRNRVCGE